MKRYTLRLNETLSKYLEEGALCEKLTVNQFLSNLIEAHMKEKESFYKEQSSIIHNMNLETSETKKMSLATILILKELVKLSAKNAYVSEQTIEFNSENKEETKKDLNNYLAKFEKRFEDILRGFNAK